MQQTALRAAADAGRYLHLYIMSNQSDLTPGEIVIRKSSGNFRQDSNGLFAWIGGKWILTNKRMIFESNWTNYQSKRESIYLEDISSIGIKYHDFLSSKLTVFLKGDSIVELHVKDRKKWRDDILNAQNSLL